MEETADTLDLNNMLDSLNKYTEDSKLGSELDLSSISKNLISGKNNDYSKVVEKVIDIFAVVLRWQV